MMKLAPLWWEEEETQLPRRPRDREAEVASRRERALAEGESRNQNDPHEQAGVFPSTPAEQELTFLALNVVSKQTAAT